jgi:intraflagellar transport protein 88
MLAAKLIAPKLQEEGNDGPQGYDWIVEVLKTSPHPEIASELEIAKAVSYLKSKDFAKAIEVLKAFERKDKKLMGTAATNLSFLYFLDRDYKQAEKYADLAIATDRYNAKAITNKGNCLYQKGGCLGVRA